MIIHLFEFTWNKFIRTASDGFQQYRAFVGELSNDFTRIPPVCDCDSTDLLICSVAAINLFSNAFPPGELAIPQDTRSNTVRDGAKDLITVDIIEAYSQLYSLSI